VVLKGNSSINLGETNVIPKSFLLQKAHDIATVATEAWYYDETLQLSTINDAQESTPVCMTSSVTTGSKTEAAPGDDDPDPDAEFMY
jgi:hypothetical protein